MKKERKQKNPRIKWIVSSVISLVLVIAMVVAYFVTAAYEGVINLALGRTEVFKSELLELISSGSMSDERLDAEIKVRETDVTEYFELLLKQLQ